MSNTLYYGEMVAKISALLHRNPDHLKRIDHVMCEDQSTQDTIWTICADAGKVFDTIEDLSGEHFIDWHTALEHYAQEVQDFILLGKRPQVRDMISMAARSIENST
ncbi:MAG: hypothetical protein JXQ90_17970 [Cyclobacteriaceae bacterium]